MKIQKLWFADEKIFILTDDGRELWQSLLWYPRLRRATKEQRMQYVYGEIGIRWEEIDEDMSLESFLYDNPEPEGIPRFFLLHPELNASAVARRMGMERSLMVSYINGSKKPSRECEDKIMNTIRQIGEELSSVRL
ncbi:MAG: DUF2442 domain-containing protein [Tannerellaceae bacterium]|jgi:hypothetical protein|nr:DUF2442 domain-containing protein [Tannerellaceae bacterium]